MPDQDAIAAKYGGVPVPSTSTPVTDQAATDDIAKKYGGVPVTAPTDTTEPRGVIGRAVEGFGDPLGLGMVGRAIAHPIDTATTLTGGIPEGQTSNPIIDTVVGEAKRVKDQLKQAWNAPNTLKGANEAVNHTLYAIPLFGGGFQKMDEDAKAGNVAGVLGGVAGLVTSLMAPEALKKIPAVAKSASKATGVLEGKPNPLTPKPSFIGEELTPGRAKTGLPRSAEQYLRNKGGEHAEPFLSQDAAARKVIQDRGAQIADSIGKMPGSIEEQGATLQDALKQVRETAGKEVGDTHRTISELAPDVQLDTAKKVKVSEGEFKSLDQMAQEAIDKLSIAGESKFAGLESPEASRLSKFFQEYLSNEPITETIPASTILDETGHPLRSEQIIETPRTAAFSDSNKLLKAINDMIPSVTSTEGGILKRFATTLRQTMYDALPPDLAKRLQESHANYHTVVEQLENGVGKHILGSEKTPIAPERVADYLTRQTGLSSIGVSELRNLLGSQRIGQVAQLVTEKIFSNPEPNALVKAFANLPEATKTGLFTPEQLQNVTNYIDTVRRINLEAEGGKLAPTFGKGSGIAIHSATGMILNAGRNLALHIGGPSFARAILDRQVSPLMTKALVTPAGSRGATQLTQRLLFAAHQSEVMAQKKEAEANNGRK